MLMCGQEVALEKRQQEQRQRATQAIAVRDDYNSSNAIFISDAVEPEQNHNNPQTQVFATVRSTRDSTQAQQAAARAAAEER